MENLKNFFFVTCWEIVFKISRLFTPRAHSKDLPLEVFDHRTSCKGSASCSGPKSLFPFTNFSSSTLTIQTLSLCFLRRRTSLLAVVFLTVTNLCRGVLGFFGMALVFDGWDGWMMDLMVTFLICNLFFFVSLFLLSLSHEKTFFFLDTSLIYVFL